MRKLIIVCLVIAVALSLVLGSTGIALAGQPGQSCEDQPASPGSASSAPGSPFNSNGVSGSHYAGEQPQNSKNPKSVSQYDVACFQVSNH